MASLLTKLKPKRRWMQVSLRTVLVLVTLLCIALSLWVVPAERQRRAVAAIRKLGGGIVFRMQPTSEVLRRWLPLTYLYEVEMVDLNNTQVTDAGLAQLQGLTSLQWLYLDNTKITDAGLAHLQGLRNVQYLYLDNTQVTDAGLAHLERLTGLQWLGLTSTQVTDAGLAQLRRTLPDCQITGP